MIKEQTFKSGGLKMSKPLKMTSINEFYKQNPDIFRILAAYLKVKGFRIDLHRDDKELPIINSSMSGEGEGGYFCIEQCKCLDPGQYELIDDLFPIKIKNYNFEKVAVSDFEYDDDRVWKPSISFIIYKGNHNILPYKELMDYL